MITFVKTITAIFTKNLILTLSLQVKACIQTKNSIKDIKHATESYVGISDAKILTGL